MSIQDSETQLAQAAALAKPASVIYDKFINNAVGDPQIVTRAGVIPSLSDIIKTLQNSANGGASKVYDTISDGISATKDKEIFVVATSGLYKLYQNNAGASLLLGVLSVENFTTALMTKLNGVAPNATANSTDAQLRDRATHTGTQAISTIDNLSNTLTSFDSNLTLTNVVVNSHTTDLTKLKQLLVTNATNSLGAGYHYTLTSTVSSVNLPPASSSVTGDVIFLSKTIAATVVINSVGGTQIVTETKGADTQVNYNLNIPLKFTFNGTNWELEGV